MIISVGKSGEENQYQRWLERTASTAIDASGFLRTRIFQLYAGAREYIGQICFDSKGHLETWAHSACTEIAGMDHEEFIENSDQHHLSLSSRRRCASSKRFYQRILYCGVSDVRSIPYLQSMVQRMAKSLAVSRFHAGFYQATQLNGVTCSRRFEQFQFALLEASAPL
jgi:heme-degrading monooxygenase HmoA